jgi:formate hydrogenlyase transcriptional activator
VAERLSDRVPRGKRGFRLLVEYLVGVRARRPVRQSAFREENLTSWLDRPGVRELQNVIGVPSSCTSHFSVDGKWLRPKSPQRSGRPVSRHGVLAEDKKEFADRERKAIEAALAECDGRVSGPRGAAAILGIPHQTLESKIVSLGIDKGRFKARPSKRRSD